MTGLRLNWKQIMLNFSAASWAGRGGAERSGAGSSEQAAVVSRECGVQDALGRRQRPALGLGIHRPPRPSNCPEFAGMGSPGRESPV